MSTKVRINYGNIWLEFDAANVKDAIEQISHYQEVFGEKTCGRCGSAEITFAHRRDNENHDYYSAVCIACGCQMDFGQHRTGDTLFAKRKDASGNYDNEHRGWYHYKDRQRSDAREASGGTF